MEERWHTVDRALADLVAGHDPVLDEALAANAAAGLPAIDVSPLHGKLLYVLARGVRADDPRARHARRLQHDLARTCASFGLAFTRALGLSRALRVHWRMVSTTSGALLVAFDVLLATGELTRLTSLLSRLTGLTV